MSDPPHPLAWAVVRPNPQLREAIEGGAPIGAAQTVQRVFRQQSGRTVLGTDKLTVRFKPTAHSVRDYPLPEPTMTKAVVE